MLPPTNVRDRFLNVFGKAGFRHSHALSLVQPSIKTSFLFSVGFVDVIKAIAGDDTELDGAATVQRCFRHFDIKRVQDGQHLSLFEMAGALRCSDWSVEGLVAPLIQYLLEECHLPKARLHVTYFNGGNVSGLLLQPDIQARDAYLNAGISEENIWPGNHSSNIWFEGANSGTKRSGICGPHSEVFFALAPHTSTSKKVGPLMQPSRFLEVSNIVTITHRARLGMNNGLLKLPRPLVELAVGMERIEMASADVASVYQTPKLRSLSQAVLSACVFPETTETLEESLHIAVDHVRAITHLLADGGRPGPKGQGHVMRQLFRRLLDAANALRLDIREAYPTLAQVIADIDETINPNLQKEMAKIMDVVDREAHRMRKNSRVPITS